jgi:hypothetical protein
MAWVRALCTSEVVRGARLLRRSHLKAVNNYSSILVSLLRSTLIHHCVKNELIGPNIEPPGPKIASLDRRRVAQQIL